MIIFDYFGTTHVSLFSVPQLRPNSSDTVAYFGSVHNLYVFPSITVVVGFGVLAGGAGALVGFIVVAGRIGCFQQSFAPVQIRP